MIKFSNVNQKVMGIYVEAQTAINAKRMAELESQLKQQQEAQQQQVALQQPNLNGEQVAVNPVQVTGA